MGQNIALVVCYGIIYAAFDAWTGHTAPGRAVKKYLVEWRSDSLLHLILCGLTVSTFGVAAIFALALTLMKLGL